MANLSKKNEFTKEYVHSKNIKTHLSAARHLRWTDTILFTL